MKTRIQNKETFKRVLFWSNMVICLLLIGCKDKSINHLIRGNDHLNKGEYNQAISEFTKAIETNPGFTEAYNNRGWAYFHVCKMETLIEAYEMAKRNNGAPGIDGATFEAIEDSGIELFLQQIRNELVRQ